MINKMHQCFMSPEAVRLTDIELLLHMREDFPPTQQCMNSCYTEQPLIRCT